MPEKNEHYDAFAVPRNFGEDGISFNGLSRRNLAEGCVLALATGYYHFSVRTLENFALAEITIYGVSKDQFAVLSQELTKMSNLLDEIFGSF